MNDFVAWLDRPVDPYRDHVLGPRDAQVTLVEYGSYDCPHCRAANDVLTQVRNRLGDRLRYVFRHRPVFCWSSAASSPSCWRIRRSPRLRDAMGDFAAHQHRGRRGMLLAAIAAALIIGKPLGMALVGLLAVFGASLVSAIAGVAILWNAKALAD